MKPASLSFVAFSCLAIAACVSEIHRSYYGDAPQWMLTPIVSIGPDAALEADGPETFGAVHGVALGPDGTVFVADGLNREIRVFGPDGEHLRTFGRRGEGPGEFGSLNSIVWVGDKLLALDFANGRVGEFSFEGEWLGQRSEFGGIGGGGGALRFYPVATDLAYVLTYDPTRSAMVFAGHASEGPTADTLHALSAPEGTISGIRCTSGEALMSFAIPFAPKIVQHPGPGGTIWSAVTDQYRMARTRGADTSFVGERELPAELVTDAEWEAGLADFLEFVDENPSADCEPRRPDKPVAKPFVSDLFATPDGHLWVEVVRNAGNHWDVFNAGGRLVGSLPATDRSVAPAFADDRLAIARLDSLGIGHVEVYQVERQPGR